MEKIKLKISKMTHDLKKHDNQVNRSDDPLPKNGACLVYCLIGGKGSGKSSLALSILKSVNGYKGYFDNIFLISPTASRDPKFEKLINELKEDNKVYTELDENVMDEIINKLDSFNDEFDSKAEKRQPNNLCIFDDCLSMLPKSTEKSRFNELITTSRHRRCSVWIMSQKYNSINPLIRSNTDLISMFRTNNKRELETFYDDINMDKKILEKCYDFATQEANSFLHVSKPVLYKKFDKIILD